MNTNVLIVGDSGSGKSSTFRNLDPKTTVVLNVERKDLPFRSFSKFKNINIKTYKEFSTLLKELQKDAKYKTVVIDSMTSLIEIIDKYCKAVYTGYSVWAEYNDLIWNTLQDIKDLPQQVFVTAIPEFIEVKPNEYKAFARVKAKEHKGGGIEKEFTIVLHTDLVEDDEGNITDFRLDTRSNKHNSSKSPDGLFKERYIPNDAALIMEAINEYYA